MSGLSIGRVRACDAFCQAFSRFATLKKQRAAKRITQPFEMCSSSLRRRAVPYLSTASLKPCPAAKAGTVLAEILISLPLAGLRPARALRLRGRKVPKPTTVTRLPFATLATIASNTAFTASPAAALLTLLAFAATWTRSDLVTTCGMRSPLFAAHRIQIEIEKQRGRDGTT